MLGKSPVHVNYYLYVSTTHNSPWLYVADLILKIFLLKEQRWATMSLMVEFQQRKNERARVFLPPSLYNVIVNFKFLSGGHISSNYSYLISLETFVLLIFKKPIYLL